VERHSITYSAFQIERSNPKAITSEWIAETAVWSEVGASLSRIITKAKKVHAAYLRSGKMGDRLLRTAICLAQLDVIYRKPIYFEEVLDPYFKTLGRIDLKDVKIYGA